MGVPSCLEMQIERGFRNQKPLFDELLRPFEVSILMFNADHVVVSHVVKGCQEPFPVHQSHSRKPGPLPAKTAVDDPILVQHVAIYIHVLGMNVEYPLLELIDEPDVINVQPHEVGGIEIQS